ncbi:myocyte enhancer factor [Saccoglossus kowalevskii]|uniref:Myocyte enhancer factor n=1 Tax=Saccoglossus kowalevskii TaxID=10224 RepID=D1LX67_SACKO|nr:myocyte enhancer factor [Saccoglossus kowalevskii]ACY92573.1 myocyte enhancer factor [Saccoglossus kowalevskii]
MGRKKIQISRINDERNRQVTFTKRKFGLMKKAYELSVLCDCEIALIIFNSSNKLFQYASTDMDKVLLKYTEYNEPHESRTNHDIIEALNKKENKGCESPEPGDEPYQLTPRTEAKYSKINEEFELMMHSNTVMPRGSIRNSYPQNMPVSIPVSQANNMTGYSSNASSSMLQPPQHTLGRNSVSPVSNMTQPQRPSSSGPPSTVLSNDSSSATSTSTGTGTTDHHLNYRKIGYSSNQEYISSSVGSNYGNPSRTSPGGTSPGGLVTKAMTKQSPTATRPQLRVVIPTSRGLPQGISANPNQSLATPTVSLATPSNPPGIPNYPSAMPTAFQSGDFALNTADLSQLSNFNSPGTLPLSAVSAWQHQHPLSAAVQAAGITGSTPSSSTPGLLTTDRGMGGIKSEPISPPRDKNQLNPTAGRCTPHDTAMSPGRHSHCSSASASPFAGSDREDGRGGGDSNYQSSGNRGSIMGDKDGPPTKRQRIENAWST